ncbi:virulence RhuM family protein [Azospirillum aestuarii]|uniref:virulence RhuM family protein n=1 Tax=Azospirillum aestuarii TaxID=2802052 RepID=UPI0040551A42
MPDSNVILYRTDDGKAEFRLATTDGSVWLSQAEIADLYQITPQAVTQHVKGVYAEGELTEEATCKSDLQVRTEGNRRVQRSIRLYRLDMILAVGYRVRSPRGVQFRQWATATLAEYLVKGFVMNDERLKNPGGWDYFDELLERIRDIRASEKRFYQKIRDLFALSQDYRDDHGAAALFFAEVQNKLLHAVTGHTAAELVVDRSDPGKPNMNLQSWTGARVRKADVIVAKNYLAAGEITELNRIVTMFLDYAEDRVSQRKHLTLDDWRANVDRFITFNERPLLNGNGRISHDAMKRIAHDRYDEFDRQRKQQDAIAADAADIEELRAIEAEMSKTRKGSGR